MKKLNWQNYFNTELDLIETFKNTDFINHRTIASTLNATKDKFQSMKNYMLRNGSLSDKQITALKRQAYELKCINKEINQRSC